MLSTIEIIIRIAILMAGVAIHWLFPDNIGAIIIGILLIFFAPLKMYRNYEHRIYEDPANADGEWRDFPDDKLTELLNLIPHVSCVSGGGASKYAIDGATLSVIIFLAVWGAGFFGGMLMAFDVPFIVVIDVILIIIAIYRLYGGSLKVHPVSLQADILQAFQDLMLPKGFSKKFQAQIVKDVNGDPDILNVRMQIRPDDPISGLLCMMATISRTNVQGKNYPFAYFVIVFGGTTFNCTSTQFMDELQKSIISKLDYCIETNINDGNSVIIILPRKPKYSTNASDCAQLCDMILTTCVLCQKHRSEIEKIAKPYDKK